MSKKFILFIVVFVISLFTVSYTFAANNAVDNVRNAVGGAENVIENAGKGIGNVIKDGTNTLENGGKNFCF